MRGLEASYMNDHLLGQAVAEKLLVGITAEILERQNCNPDLLNHGPPVRTGRLRHGYRGEEAVTAAGDGLDKTRRRRRVVQSLSKFADGLIETMVEVNEGLSTPYLALNFFSGDDLAGLAKQEGENLQWLFLELYSDSILAQFSRAQVDLIEPES
jgi:hypothetical protein